jgi:hypothetical protein
LQHMVSYWVVDSCYRAPRHLIGLLTLSEFDGRHVCRRFDVTSLEKRTKATGVFVAKLKPFGVPRHWSLLLLRDFAT